MRKNLLTALLIVIFAAIGHAQSFEVPTNYTFETEADYKKYEQEILACIDWMGTKDAYSNPEANQKAVQFFLEWVTGSPTVTITIPKYASKFFEDPTLLFHFMTGWTGAAIKNPKITELEANVAGVDNVIAFYITFKDYLSDNKAIKKLIKQQQKGKLKNYLAKKIK